MFDIKNLKPLFLLGYPKSGTTMLLSLLDSHPSLLVFPEELMFFTKVYHLGNDLNKKREYITTKTGALVPSKGIYEAPSGVRDYSKINGKLYFEGLIKLLNKSKTNKELFESVYQNWLQFSNVGDSPNLKYFVEKTPLNEYYLKIIKEYFPDAMFIHIVRDPRDNFLSYRKQREYQTPEKFSFQWAKSTEIALKNKGKNYLVIKYEDFVSDSENYLNQICDFLNIEFNEILLKPTRNGELWMGNSKFGDNTGTIHKQAVSRYKSKLPVQEIEKLENYLYKYLTELKYPIDYSKAPAKIPFLKRLKESAVFFIKKKV